MFAAGNNFMIIYYLCDEHFFPKILNYYIF